MAVEFEFQKALFLALDAQKVSLGVTGVYDIAPQAADSGDASVFPYVVIGRTFINNRDTQTCNGFEVTARIHVFSRTGAMQECKRIQALIYGILHRQPLSVTGFNNFELLRSETDCLPDQDGKIHGVCEYLALVEASA
jgi:hypothetical protein